MKDIIKFRNNSSYSIFEKIILIISLTIVVSHFSNYYLNEYEGDFSLLAQVISIVMAFVIYLTIFVGIFNQGKLSKEIKKINNWWFTLIFLISIFVSYFFVNPISLLMVKVCNLIAPYNTYLFNLDIWHGELVDPLLHYKLVLMMFLFVFLELIKAIIVNYLQMKNSGEQNYIKFLYGGIVLPIFLSLFSKIAHPTKFFSDNFFVIDIRKDAILKELNILIYGKKLSTNDVVNLTLRYIGKCLMPTLLLIFFIVLLFFLDTKLKSLKKSVNLGKNIFLYSSLFFTATWFFIRYYLYKVTAFQSVGVVVLFIIFSCVVFWQLWKHRDVFAEAFEEQAEYDQGYFDAMRDRNLWMF